MENKRDGAEAEVRYKDHGELKCRISYGVAQHIMRYSVPRQDSTGTLVGTITQLESEPLLVRNHQIK